MLSLFVAATGERYSNQDIPHILELKLEIIIKENTCFLYSAKQA